MPMRTRSHASAIQSAYDNFMGRLAVGRIYAGTVRPNQQVFIKAGRRGAHRRTTKVFTFKGLERIETEEAKAEISHSSLVFRYLYW